MIFRKIDADYPYRLLLQADETREGINEYLFDSEVYVAVTQGKSVGVMCLLRRDRETMELMNIAVDEPFRGRGIGNAILEKAARIASAEGCRKVIVGTGTEDCAPSQIRFYERNGFVKSSLRKDYFIERHPEPIFENGVQLRDMQVLARNV